MTEKIIDYNRVDTDNMIFHFKNDLTPYISVYNIKGDEMMFINLNTWEAYSIDYLEYLEIEFYEKEDDEEFKGVAVIEEDFIKRG